MALPLDVTAPAQTIAASDNEFIGSSAVLRLDGYNRNSVQYATGELRVISADLVVTPNGLESGHSRRFMNRVDTVNTSSQGNGWFVNELPQVVKDSSGNIVVIGPSADPLWFQKVGNSPPTYTGMFAISETLVEDTTNKVLSFVNKRGELISFNSFDLTLPAAVRGQFKSLSDRYGTLYSPSLTTSSSISSMAIGSVQLQYAYVSAGNNAGKLDSVTHNDTAIPVRMVQFTYYDTGDANGNLGDLKSATVKQWNGLTSSWEILGTSYYRYYTANTAPGYMYGLKFVVEPQSYATMVAASIVPESVSDSILAGYADHYLEYNNSTEKRVSKEVVNAQGTTSGYTKSTYLHTYSSSSSSSSSSPDYNAWTMKATEVLPDANSNIVYSNFAGQVMLKILQRSSDSAKWYEYNKYDGSGRLVMKVESSGIASYSEGTSSLVTLRTTSGLFRTFYYYATTNPATGAVAGMLQFEKIKQGSSGAEVLIHELQYATQTASNGAVVYVVSKDIQYQSDSGGGTNPAETDFSYDWYTGTVQMKGLITTWPLVSTLQNGSGASAFRAEQFDTSGLLTWEKDECGFLTRYQTSPSTGSVTQRIDDVLTTLITDSPSVPTGWSTPSTGGLHLITDTLVDSLGRMTRELGPSHQIALAGVSTTIRRVRWSVYRDAQGEVRAAQGYATGAGPSYTYALIEPLNVTLVDHFGRLTDVYATKRAAGVSGALTASESVSDQTLWVSWMKNIYQNNSLLSNTQHKYFSIPATGLGSIGVNFNEILVGFDAMDRLNRTQSGGGTIRRSVYHVQGWLLSNWIGTNDVGATDSDPTGGGASGNNMVQLDAYTYDSGSSGFDGNLTNLLRFENATTTRSVDYGYDFRNRQTNITGEANIYRANTYDNLNRITQVDQRNTNISGNLIARSTTSYDSRGRAYSNTRFGVDPSSGTVGNGLTENFWYDPIGNIIKHSFVGNSLVEKTVINGAARRIQRFLSINTSETGYPFPVSVTADTVLQQDDSTFDPAGNIVQHVKKLRMHDAGSTLGALGDPSTAPTARAYYKAMWHDPVGREIGSADYGTNGGSSFTRPSTVPSRSDIVLLTTTNFDSAGNPFEVIDAAGISKRTSFDAMRRTTSVVENYVSGGSNLDQNREVDFSYTADDAILHVTAKNAITGDQITKFVYGVDRTNSDLVSNELLRAVIYPDSTDPESPLSGTNHISIGYNRLSEQTIKTDQLGTTHQYVYDKLGRVLHDEVIALGTNVDGAVRRITKSYEIRGLVATVTSYDNQNPGTGTTVNDVLFNYNSYGQLITEYQSHSGAVVPATSPKVQYAYADGASNSVRQTSTTYPGGQQVTMNYGTSGTLDDLLSRIVSLVRSTTTFVSYKYLGLDQIIEADYVSQPGVKLSYVKQGAEPNGEGGDQYSGLDRFARVVDQRWIKSSTGVSVERIQYGFDRRGNRLYRQNPVAGSAQDELYSYDGLNRLLDLVRGTLNAGRTAITGTPTWEEISAFDLTNNRHGVTSGYITKVSGSITLDQNRIHSQANAITGINTNSGTAWSVPTYVMNGTSTNGDSASIPRPLLLGSSYGCIYDAWDRLVSIKNGAATVANLKYDGLNRRTAKNSTTNRDFYYSSKWQVIEERQGPSNPCVERQFVWGLRYDDDLIMRERDTAGGSSSSSCAGTNERVYVLHDYFNVTAIIDTGGLIKERYGYDAFGASRVMNSSFGTLSASAYDWEIRFGAYLWDSETGLYLVRNRYLHPNLGTWLTRDPVGLPAGINLYGYADANPINAVDPNGLFVIPKPTCGPDVTRAVLTTLSVVQQTFQQHWTFTQQFSACTEIYNLTTDPVTGLVHAANAWDMIELYLYGKQPATNPCRRSVVFGGKCAQAGAVNYTLWGLIQRLCSKFSTPTFPLWGLPQAIGIAYFWKINHYKGETIKNDTTHQALSFSLFGYTGSTLLIPTVGCPLTKTVVKNPAFHWVWEPLKPRPNKSFSLVL